MSYGLCVATNTVNPGVPFDKGLNLLSSRVLSVNQAYPIAVEDLKTEEILTQACEFRQNKYLNNILEQDHRFIKKLVNPSLGFKSFYTARRTITGYETMNQIRKGQVCGVAKGDTLGQVKFIAQIFGVAA